MHTRRAVKTNEPILSGPLGKEMKDQFLGQEVKGQGRTTPKLRFGECVELDVKPCYTTPGGGIILDPSVE